MALPPDLKECVELLTARGVEFVIAGNRIQLGHSPVRVDFLTSLTSVDFVTA